MAGETVYLITGANRGECLSYFATSSVAAHVAQGLVRGGDASRPFFNRTQYDVSNFQTLIRSTGLGKEMVATFLQRPNTIVVGTVRDPAHETAKSLSELSTAAGSKLIVLPLDMKDIDSLSKKLADAGITRLDVVISNAGTCEHFHLARDEDAESLRHTFEINSIGPLRLFQTSWPLLSSAEGGQKKFVLITSSLGSFGLIEQHDMPGAAYGAAKAAANWLAKKLWVECKGEGLKVGIIHPGYVFSRF